MTSEYGRREHWQVVVCDALEKVFPDEAPRPLDRETPTTLVVGERVSWQIALLPPSLEASGPRLPGIVAEVVDDGGLDVTVGVVDLVPVTAAAFDGHDDGYLRDRAGLFPDPIRPLRAGEAARPFIGQWIALWVDATARDAPEESTSVRVALRGDDGSPIGEAEVDVRVVRLDLAELDIVSTHWFHADGLAAYYGDDVFDEGHWASIDASLAALAEIGSNSVLTPVWTPPLDTAIGGVRTATQLLGIREHDGAYAFDFSGLRRWMRLCELHGIRYLEMPHLFTQWGARATPAVYIDEATGPVRRFGWDVAATDPAYRLFLEQLLPALRSVLDEEWGLERVLFHISDEPPHTALAEYAAARAVVADLLEGCRVVDALSDLDFVERGEIDMPIVATDRAQPFLDAGVPHWLYYCIDQTRDVANRFMALPALRNRVIGTQLYLSRAEGFLHWGLNFYNTALSRRTIDPFADTCAGGEFLGGDAFIVYPGPDRTVWHSTRGRVFADAMLDHRLMAALREREGDEAVRGIVDPDGALTLSRFPQDAQHYLRAREAVIDRLLATD